VGLQLDTNLAGDCIVSYIVPDFAAERSGLFGVDDLVLSINGTDLNGVSSTPILLRLCFQGTLIWHALVSGLI
jgi:C-terminal processing protease CtpA/Prc